MASNAAAPTLAMWPKAAHKMFAAWPQVAVGTAQGISTRAGLYLALYLCRTTGATWAAAVPQGMAAAGAAVCAHIAADGSARYAAAGYLQRMVGVPKGTALTAAQLAALTPTQVATALARYANFTASVANYNGAATALAALTHGTPQAAYMAPIANAAVVPQAGTAGNAVVSGWAGQQAPQPV